MNKSTPELTETTTIARSQRNSRLFYEDERKGGMEKNGMGLGGFMTIAMICKNMNIHHSDATLAGMVKQPLNAYRAVRYNTLVISTP
jgi:hypothetical protein